MGSNVQPGVHVNREPHVPSSRSKGNASIPRLILLIPSCFHLSPIIHLYLLSFIIIVQSRSISGTRGRQEVASDCLPSGPSSVISCMLILGRLFPLASGRRNSFCKFLRNTGFFLTSEILLSCSLEWAQTQFWTKPVGLPFWEEIGYPLDLTEGADGSNQTSSTLLITFT